MKMILLLPSAAVSPELWWSKLAITPLVAPKHVACFKLVEIALCAKCTLYYLVVILIMTKKKELAMVLYLSVPEDN